MKILRIQKETVKPLNTGGGEPMLLPMLLTNTQRNLAFEYARLATRSELSEQEVGRMSEILEEAQFDESLSFLINEIDYFIEQELNFKKEDSVNTSREKEQKIIAEINNWLKAKTSKDALDDQSQEDLISLDEKYIIVHFSGHGRPEVVHFSGHGWLETVAQNYVKDIKKNLKFVFSSHKFWSGLYQITPEQQSLAKEYSRLASRSELFHLEVERMGEILEIAQNDDSLSFLINEIDFFVSQKLNLSSEEQCSGNESVSINSLIELMKNIEREINSTNEVESGFFEDATRQAPEESLKREFLQFSNYSINDNVFSCKIQAIDAFPPKSQAFPEHKKLTIAFIGECGLGKSTFLNSLYWHQKRETNFKSFFEAAKKRDYFLTNCEAVLAQNWRSRLATDNVKQSSDTMESVVRWLLGSNSGRFEMYNSDQLFMEQQAMEYHYRILLQCYLNAGIEQAYCNWLTRLAGLAPLRNKIQIFIAFNKDNRLTVLDVFQQVIQELLQKDTYVQQQMSWITECTANVKLRNAMLFTITEGYCSQIVKENLKIEDEKIEDMLSMIDTCFSRISNSFSEDNSSKITQDKLVPTNTGHTELQEELKSSNYDFSHDKQISSLDVSEEKEFILNTELPFDRTDLLLKGLSDDIESENLSLTNVKKIQKLFYKQRKLLRERLRQTRHSFNLALIATAVSTCISLVGSALILSGKVGEGTVTTAGGMVASVLCIQLAKDANDRLDKVLAELKD